MKILIVSGGKPPSKGLLEDELASSQCVICADSGANTLYNYGVVPDYLIGDFDSIAPGLLDKYKAEKCSTFIYPPEKDFTDTQLAVQKAVEFGATELVLLGCTGSRIDHMLGNLGMLKYCLDRGIKACIKDDNNTVFLTDVPCELTGKPGDIISFQAYCDMVGNLSIKGAKYPLEKYDLRLGDPLTVSNEFLESKVSVDFKHGILMVIYGKD